MEKISTCNEKVNENGHNFLFKAGKRYCNNVHCIKHSLSNIMASHLYYWELTGFVFKRGNV